MKKILSLTLCILLFAFAIFPASAEVVVQEEDYYRDGDYLFEIIEGSEISITYYIGTQSTPIIPSSIGGLPVTHIGERAFFGNDIKEVTIPDGVTHIAEEAFYNCQSLESVTLPKSLESMGTAIFRFCQNLKTVTFSGADTSPILGKYTFYACNSLESVNIPEGVTNIPEGMFAFCESLENITLPQNTESVYDYAFYGSGLRSITLPESLDYIGDMAFAECSSLSDVYFGGTIKQWNAVEIGVNNGYLRSATIHCQETSEEMFNIFFSNNRNWNSVYIYGYYGSDINNPTAEPLGTYPGTNMTFVEKNSYGQDIYSAEVPADIDYIMFTDSSAANNRTNYIPKTEIADNTGFYLTDDLGNAKWDYDTYEHIPAEPEATEPEATEPEVTEPEVATITIYFENNWAWPEVSIYYWGGADGENATWPGEIMTEIVGKNNDGVYDIYKMEIPSDVAGVIFSGEGAYGRDQSTDVTEITDGTVYYMVWDDATSSKICGSYPYVAEDPVEPEVTEPEATEPEAPYETDNLFSFAKNEIAAIGANSTDSGIITEDNFLIATTFDNVVIREKDLLAEVGAQVEADLGAKMTAATNVRLRGDANCDNQINIRDATIIQKYAASIIKINDSGFDYKNADVDADGKVNVKDATLIQKHLVGIAQIPTGPIQSA